MNNTTIHLIVVFNKTKCFFFSSLVCGKKLKRNTKNIIIILQQIKLFRERERENKNAYEYFYECVESHNPFTMIKRNMYRENM